MGAAPSMGCLSAESQQGGWLNKNTPRAPWLIYLVPTVSLISLLCIYVYVM